jgi:hypothetical protein
LSLFEAIEPVGKVFFLHLIQSSIGFIDPLVDLSKLSVHEVDIRILAKPIIDSKSKVEKVEKVGGLKR